MFEIQSVTTIAGGVDRDEGFYYEVGKTTFLGVEITRIEEVYDIPGLHCNLGRIRVWSHEQLVATLPLPGNIEHIAYKPKEAANDR